MARKMSATMQRHLWRVPAAFVLPDAIDMLQTGHFEGLSSGSGCMDATGCGRYAAKVPLYRWTDADWRGRSVGIGTDYRAEAFQEHAQGCRGVNLMNEAGHTPGVDGYAAWTRNIPCRAERHTFYADRKRCIL